MVSSLGPISANAPFETAGHEYSTLSAIFSVSSDTVMRVCKQGLDDLALLRGQLISMVDGIEAPEAAQAFANQRAGKPCFTNVVGAIDGTFVFALAGKDQKDPLISYKWPVPAMLLLIIADANRRIRWMSRLRPGSWGDKAVCLASDITGVAQSVVLRRLQLRAKKPALRPDTTASEDTGSAIMHSDLKSLLAELFFEVPEGFVVLGDGGFKASPHLVIPGGDAMGKHINRKRLKSHWKTLLRTENVLDSAFFDHVLSSHRIVVERTFGSLIGSFSILRCGRYSVSLMDNITLACAIVHNARIMHGEQFQPPHLSTELLLLSEVNSRRGPSVGRATDGEGTGISLIFDRSKSINHNRDHWIALLRDARQGWASDSSEHEDDEENPAKRVKRTLSTSD